MERWLVGIKKKIQSGYAYIPGWLLSSNIKISDEAKVTWIMIYKIIKNKKVEYPKVKVSLDSIAELRGKSKMAIQRHLKELKEAGCLSTIRRYNKPSEIILHMGKERNKGQKA